MVKTQIKNLRECIQKSSAFPQMERYVAVAIEILVVLFFAGMLFSKSLLDATAVIALVLFCFARFLKIPKAFPRFLKSDSLFVIAICLSVALLFLSSAIQVSLGLSEKIYIWRDLRYGIRVVVATFVFCCFSKRALPLCVFAASVGFAIAAGAEYIEHGIRVGYGMDINPNQLATTGIWLMIPSLYFAEHKESSLAIKILSLISVAAALCVVAFAGSRGAFAGVVCVLAFYAFSAFLTRGIPSLFKRRFAVSVFCVVVLCAVSALPNLALGRIDRNAHEIFEKGATIENLSGDARPEIWACSMTAIHDANFVCGIGREPWNFQFVPAFQKLDPFIRLPHNEFLGWWLKYGILGAFASFFFQFSGVAQSIISMRSRGREVEARSRFALLGALFFSFLWLGLFDVRLWEDKYLFIAVAAFLFFKPIVDASRRGARGKGDSSASKILFFLRNCPDLRAGGPRGYLANLAEGFAACGKPFPLIADGLKESRHLVKLLSCWCPTKRFRQRFRNWIRIRFFGDDVDFAGGLTKTAKVALSAPNLKWVFTESVADFVAVKKFLSKENPNVKIALMSHAPERPLDECVSFWDSDFKKGLFSKKQQKIRIENARCVEAEAFRHADLILFPSREAMEPYFSTWQEFSEIIKNKDIRFLETGCAPLQLNKNSRDHVLEKYGLNKNASLRICFIGRHQSVKGYDLLISAAKMAWEKMPNAEFVVGGNPSSEIEPPADSRWKECGYVDPVELLNVADVFVLPNRRTYFDLVLLEVLSTGVPIIATATGGNKSIATLSGEDGGIILCEPTAESIAEKILVFSTFPEKKREQIRERNVALHHEKFSPSVFAQRYFTLFEDLLGNETNNATQNKNNLSWF